MIMINFPNCEGLYLFYKKTRVFATELDTWSKAHVLIQCLL